jgi:hypothetical protein
VMAVLQNETSGEEQERGFSALSCKLSNLCNNRKDISGFKMRLAYILLLLDLNFLSVNCLHLFFFKFWKVYSPVSSSYFQHILSLSSQIGPKGRSKNIKHFQLFSS